MASVHSTVIIFFVYLYTVTISCTSPRLLSLEHGYEIEAGDYGFFPLSPTSSFDDITAQLKTPRSSPRLKITKCGRAPPPPSITKPIEINYSSSTSASSSTRSRRNTPESDPYVDLESGDYTDMAVSSSSSHTTTSTPKSLPCILSRRYCCCCLPESCLNYVKLICYVFYYIIYGLILRCASSRAIEPTRTN